jgi:hypothetical protein
MKQKATIVPDWKWGTAEGNRELDRLLSSLLFGSFSDAPGFSSD